MNVCYDEMLMLERLLQKAEPSIYEEMDKLYRIEPIKYRYVKRWREKRHPRSLWFFKIALFIGDIKRFFANNVKE